MRLTELSSAAVAGLLISLPPAGFGAEDLGYDPAADPFAELDAARAAANAEDKLVLVVAGGDWCIWCHYLEAFLTNHPALEQRLEETFVVMHAYRGDDNDNASFFATLPEAAGYPHFWIVDPADGALLESQDTLPLEDGDKSYDERAFGAFVDKWRSRR
jgi:hypothetical protein